MAVAHVEGRVSWMRVGAGKIVVLLGCQLVHLYLSWGRHHASIARHPAANHLRATANVATACVVQTVSVAGLHVVLTPSHAGSPASSSTQADAGNVPAAVTMARAMAMAIVVVVILASCVGARIDTCGGRDAVVRIGRVILAIIVVVVARKMAAAARGHHIWVSSRASSRLVDPCRSKFVLAVARCIINTLCHFVFYVCCLGACRGESCPYAYWMSVYLHGM